MFDIPVKVSPPGAGDGVELQCLTCSADPRNPFKCTRPEYEGTFITCAENIKACFKSIDRSTGGKVKLN